MIKTTQAIAGIGDYLQTKIMPRLDSKRQFVAGMAYGLASKKTEKIICALADNELIKAFDLIKDDEIDIEALYEAARAQMRAQGKLKIAIPLMGEFAFNEDDLGDLYRFMIAGNEKQ